MAFNVYGNDPEQTNYEGRKCKHIKVNGVLAWNNKEDLGDLIATGKYYIPKDETTRTYESEEFDVTGYETLSGTVKSYLTLTNLNFAYYIKEKTNITIEVYNAEKKSDVFTTAFSSQLYYGQYGGNITSNRSRDFSIPVSELSGKVKLKVTAISSVTAINDWSEPIPTVNAGGIVHEEISVNAVLE